LRHKRRPSAFGFSIEAERKRCSLRRLIAQARHAPSAIAVVDPTGDLLAFERMDSVRPASAELAIQKARTAARLQRPTAEIEDNIDHGRTAFVTANIPALQGGAPIRVDKIAPSADCRLMMC
jgi:uncharacterized protein GlcG (DUF336 family)